MYNDIGSKASIHKKFNLNNNIDQEATIPINAIQKKSAKQTILFENALNQETELKKNKYSSSTANRSDTINHMLYDQTKEVKISIRSNETKPNSKLFGFLRNLFTRSRRTSQSRYYSPAYDRSPIQEANIIPITNEKETKINCNTSAENEISKNNNDADGLEDELSAYMKELRGREQG